MVTLLKPPALKTKIEADLEICKHYFRKKWLPFYKHCIAGAVACHKFVSVKGTQDFRVSDQEKPLSRGFPPKGGRNEKAANRKGIRHAVQKGAHSEIGKKSQAREESTILMAQKHLTRS